MSGYSISLPEGASVVSARETSQQSVGGQIQQGQQITVRTPKGATTSLFIPYSILGNTTAIEAAIEQRIQQVDGLLGNTPGL